MTMILQLLVAAVAVGLGVDAGMVTLPPKPPPYKENVQAMKEAAKTMEKNVFSMEGHIPLLNDSRRHYAEIVHVINYHAIRVSQSDDNVTDYYESYPKYLSISSPQAINHPQQVIDYIRDIQTNVHKNIDELLELIAACVETSDICDELIDDTVQENSRQYGRAAEVLDAAGRAAIALNKLNGKFGKVSQDLEAHQYVSTKPEDLEEIVKIVSNLHRLVDPPTCSFWIC